MNCQNCNTEIDGDPYLIGKPEKTRGDELYAEPLCKECYHDLV